MVARLPGRLLPRWALVAYWRTRERDTGQADVRGSPTAYPYGKTTELELRVISETGETPFVCCGYCAAHMACWTAVAGLSRSMFDEAHDIRSSGGRPHNSGSNATELRNGAARALDVELEAIAVDEIRGRLAAGFAVAASLQYADLPDYLKVQSNDFGHGVCLYGYRAADDCVGYFDPLWPDGALGAWARFGDLAPALWSDGNHSTTLTHWATSSPAEDEMPINAYAGLTSNLRADVPAGLPFYSDPNLARQLGAMSKAATVVAIGNPIGETVEGGARAILVNTGNAYSDGTVRPTIVYVAAGAVDPYSVPPPVSSSPDVDEAIAQNNLEWREWLLEGAPGTES